MNLYRQSIILFGVVIPLIFAVAVVSVGYVMKSKVKDSFAIKQENARTYEQAKSASFAIEKEVLRLRADLKRWEEALGQDTASLVAGNLREISDILPNKEIQQTSFERLSNSIGFGRASAQSSAHIRVAYRGTYRTLQRAFLELETRMPQLQLQDLKMEPIKSSGSLISFQASFTAWEK